MSKIVVTKKNNKIITCRYEGFDLERISVSDEGKHSLLGNIYVGKVKNIVKNIIYLGLTKRIEFLDADKNT